MTRLPQAFARSRFAVEEAEGVTSWHDKLKLLKGNWWIHASMLIAIAVGFYHGWLKLAVKSPITTFAVDIFLIVALIGIVARKDASDRLIPPGTVGLALLTFYGLCGFYLFFGLAIPGAPPLLLAAVAIRGWCFATLMFLVGYHLIRSGDQLRLYFLWIVILGVATAFYGIRQTPEDVARIVQANPEMRLLMEGQRYVDEAGNLILRRFSTFISSGAFGGAMSSVAIIALAMFTDQNLTKRDRLLFLVAAVPLTYALSLSGARSALVSALLGFVFLLVYRRSFGLLAVVALVVVIGMALGSSATSGGALDRFRTLKDTDTLLSRFWIPTVIGVDFVSENPFGGGLGKTGHLPAFLVGRTTFTEFIQSDGDLGRLLIELGVPGVGVYSWLLGAAGLQAFRVSRDTANSSNHGLALACSAMFVLSLFTFPTGSPFVGIPMGLLVWFFFGATQRLAQLQAEKKAAEVRAPAPGQQPEAVAVASAVSAPAKRHRLLYRFAAPTDAGPAKPKPARARSAFRGLYTKPPE